MNHWKCTCAVGRLRPLSSNWLWIIHLVSEISGNSCMLLIDMLLVFPFLFSKNLQTLFFWTEVWLLSACRWGRAPVWKGRCGWEVGNTPEEMGTLRPQLRIQPHVHGDKGSLSAWRCWVPEMKRPKSAVLPDSSRFSRGHARCERKSGWAAGWRALGGNSQAWKTCSNTIHPAACSCLQVNKADCNRRTSHQSTAGGTTASGARLSWYGAGGTASVGVAPRHTTSSPSGPVLTSGEKTYGMWWDKTHADNPRQPNAPR